MAWQCLLVAALLGGEPGADANESDPWDQLRQVFYTHVFTTGQVYQHAESFDRPPWTNWAPFKKQGAFRDEVIARLDAFLKLPAQQVEKQSATRRMILLRDLWAVFECMPDAERPEMDTV